MLCIVDWCSAITRFYSWDCVKWLVWVQGFAEILLNENICCCDGHSWKQGGLGSQDGFRARSEPRTSVSVGWALMT